MSKRNVRILINEPIDLKSYFQNPALINQVICFHLQLHYQKLTRYLKTGRDSQLHFNCGANLIGFNKELDANIKEIRLMGFAYDLISYFQIYNI